MTINKPKVLVAVMAHADPKAELMYKLHLPFWKAISPDIITIMPVDKHFKGAENPILFGRASHNGPDAIKRFRWIESKLLELCKKERYQKAFLFEYDSVALDPVIEPHLLSNTLFGNMFERGVEDMDPKFKSRKFFHPPILFTQDILMRLVNIANSMTVFDEQGMWDRWLGLQAQKMKIPSSGYGHLGYSRNTIEKSHYPEAIEAVKNGAIYIHGVKTPETLAVLVEARKQYVEAQTRKKEVEAHATEMAKTLSVSNALDIKQPEPEAKEVFHVEQSKEEQPAQETADEAPKKKGRPRKHVEPVEENEPEYL